ncbi:hypothetical protein IU500_12445 [Nocardia terpenica]|uniref:hypothetical protein n=1 Tax=Nocardia terpenica TaxID=455432 RepID=UPI001895DA1A|nr:hypothetical protein [Nocardia terpenica]MBF6063013.1 hypothetical protein [Nocardia terpenica]MBF6104852.1 hypothetical protein [Nocardia terpenica]MBF6112711.1 hypothetical protein [Nocardia terpenica]MBF6118580.1 hypothetical protein [Nocardia terpenica]MBF6155059.1 hypothetical protein [Nocardia terpenica]
MSRLFRDGRAQVVLCGPGEQGPVWNLTDGEDGVLLLEGFTNIYDPPTTHILRQGARQDGATWLGAMVEPRKFELPVHVSQTTMRGWRSVNDAFFESLVFDELSRLYVITQFSGYWWLDIRKDDVEEAIYTKDPGLRGHQLYRIPVLAEYPWWRGMDEEALWVNGQPPPAIHNRGNRPAWYKLIVKGPGVLQIPDGDGRIVTLPKLKPGQILRVDTDPDQRTIIAVNPEENLFRAMGANRFRKPIAKRSVLTLNGIRFIDGTAESSVVIRVEPKNRGPW